MSNVFRREKSPRPLVEGGFLSVLQINFCGENYFKTLTAPSFILMNSMPVSADSLLMFLPAE